MTDLAELPAAKAIFLDVNPKGLRALAGERLPRRYARALDAFHYGPGAAKVDFLVSEPIPSAAHEVGMAGTVHLGGTRTETSSVYLTPDATALLASNGDQYALGTGRRVPGLQGQDTLQAARFSRDGNHLAVSTRDGRVTLWDRLGRHRNAVLAQADHEVRNEPLPVAFSADGEFVAVGNQDGSVRVWETASAGTPGTLIQVGAGRILGLGFTDDSDHLRIATPHSVHREVGVLDPQQAAREVCERAGGGLGTEQWDAYLPELSYRQTC
ncbi:WD40 repeat domain-containing protein [Streptomyces sp. NPDC055107]